MLKIFGRLAPQAAEKVVAETAEDLAAKAAKYGITPKKLQELRELGKDTYQRTITPERLTELHNQGIHGYYSKTVVKPDGSLEKVLSNGDRVVISKNAEGKTVRQVYRGGNLMVDDTKALSQYKVGNKTVNVKEFNRKINRMYYINRDGVQELIIPTDNAYAFNYKAERVLDSNGHLLGMRETEFFPAHYDHTGRYIPEMSYVTKTAYNGGGVTDAVGYIPSWNGYVKQFVGSNERVLDTLPEYKEPLVNSEIGVIRNFGDYHPINTSVGNNKRVVDKFHIVANGVYRQESARGVTGGLGQYKPVINSEAGWMRADLCGYPTRTGERLDNSRLYSSVSYNEKGLPLPATVKVPSNDMSLRDMRLYVQNHYPREYYNEEYPINYSGTHNYGLLHLDRPIK